MWSSFYAILGWNPVNARQTQLQVTASTPPPPQYFLRLNSQLGSCTPFWEKVQSSALATLDLSIYILLHIESSVSFWKLFVGWQRFSVTKRCLHYCYFVFKSWDCFALSTLKGNICLKLILQNPLAFEQFGKGVSLAVCWWHWTTPKLSVRVTSDEGVQVCSDS